MCHYKPKQRLTIPLQLLGKNIYSSGLWQQIKEQAIPDLCLWLWVLGIFLQDISNYYPKLLIYSLHSKETLGRAAGWATLY